MTLRNSKLQDKKLKFSNKHLKFLSKNFAENGKEKIYKQLEKFQNEYYPGNIDLIRFYILYLLRSLLKRNL